MARLSFDLFLAYVAIIYEFPCLGYCEAGFITHMDYPGSFICLIGSKAYTTC